MSRASLPLFLGLTLASVTATAGAEADQTRVAMLEKSAATFYVQAAFEGYGPVELMVDTGSGYATINEDTLSVLERESGARYVKEIRGVLADGSELTVPIYAVGRMRIGDRCWLSDVQVAVFPGSSRQILGLSALRKLAPFVFSVEPPGLLLTGCQGAPVAGSGLSSDLPVLTSTASATVN